MFKRPEGRITAAEYFSTIQYSKKSLLQENSRSRLLADFSFNAQNSLSFTTPALPGS